jgi:hypothetical protein
MLYEREKYEKEDFRQESSFFADAADPMSNLTLSPKVQFR